MFKWLLGKNDLTKRAVKLYSIDDDQKGIDRELFVSRLLSLFENEFGAPPQKYDIGGPYGVRKGQPVGVNAFRNRLERQGHKKYHWLYGCTDDKYGFDVSFGYPLNNSTYSEACIWFVLPKHSIDFRRICDALAVPFAISCAFEVDMDSKCEVTTETRIIKNRLRVRYDHLQWIPTARGGDVRDLFSKNICNENQIATFRNLGKEFSNEPYGNLQYVEAKNLYK